MHASKTPRRSSRIPFSIPILVTSLKPGTHFSEICETLVVNAHGCTLRSPTKLEMGAPLHFHSKEGRQTMAQVVDCRPLDKNERDWMLAARLDRRKISGACNRVPKIGCACSSFPIPPSAS